MLEFKKFFSSENLRRNFKFIIFSVKINIKFAVLFAIISSENI